MQPTPLVSLVPVKAAIHAALLTQLEALVQHEPDAIAAMANVSAALHGAFGWHWTGFYRVVGDELLLGPFQGPPACSRIAFGQGVCGTSWKQCRTVVVPDVDLFPGHIACSPLSRSEIVVPVFDREGQVAAVLDIDSERTASFDDTDAHALERVCLLLRPLMPCVAPR